MDKYINKNGDVAVLISDDFGAGWSTWNSEYAEAMLFDKEIVKIIVDNTIRPLGEARIRPEDYDKVKDICHLKYPGAYLGGLDGLVIEWLEPDTRFYVHEYDGQESIWTAENMMTYSA